MSAFILSMTSGESLAVISDWMNPGATALQVTPREENSFATDFVTPMMPALEAA